jgi:hypothetical protein
LYWSSDIQPLVEGSKVRNTAAALSVLNNGSTPDISVMRTIAQRNCLERMAITIASRLGYNAIQVLR